MLSSSRIFQTEFTELGRLYTFALSISLVLPTSLFRLQRACRPCYRYAKLLFDVKLRLAVYVNSVDTCTLSVKTMPLLKLQIILILE